MTKLAILLKVQPPGVPRPMAYYYQNYREVTPIVFEGRLWEWAPFQVKGYPSNDLSLNSEDTQILIARSKALDAALAQHDDFKRAIIFIYHVRLENPLATPFAIRRQVSHATRDGGNISFTLASATNATQGTVVTKRIEERDFPEAPVYKVR